MDYIMMATHEYKVGNKCFLRKSTPGFDTYTADLTKTFTVIQCLQLGDALYYKVNQGYSEYFVNENNMIDEVDREL